MVAHPLCLSCPLTPSISASSLHSRVITCQSSLKSNLESVRLRNKTLTTLEVCGRRFSPQECQLVYTFLLSIDDENGRPVAENEILGTMLHQRADLTVVHCQQLLVLLKREDSAFVREVSAAVAYDIQWWSVQAYDQYYGFMVRERNLSLGYDKDL